MYHKCLETHKIEINLNSVALLISTSKKKIMYMLFIGIMYSNFEILKSNFIIIFSKFK